MPINPDSAGAKAEPTPAEKPFSPPEVSEEGGHDARDEENSDDALANHALDEQTTIARPPLGN
ncbi:MAG: hypothetical protein JWP79_2828 [Polaromonas sp.]|jgi:hypothetical protein|nr:hypothetical protein [Polaromonas sp.]MDB5938393.1 hypothetical protein [Polaromonas sp.]